MDFLRVETYKEKAMEAGLECGWTGQKSGRSQFSCDPVSVCVLSHREEDQDSL